jgi:hypothetical protein
LEAWYTVAFDRDEHAANPHSSMVRSYIVENFTGTRFEITGATTPNGAQIPNGGYITAKSVKLTGFAAAGREIRIFNRTTFLDSVKADPYGTWEYVFNILSKGTLKFNLRTADGAYSGFWQLVSVEEEMPFTTRVMDSKGELAEYDSTTELTVKLTGEAKADEEVEISVRWIPVENVPVNADGKWSCTVAVVHSGGFTGNYVHVKARYGNGLQSMRTVFCSAPSVPVVKSMTDSMDRVISYQGATYDEAARFSGIASASEEVEIFVNNISRGCIRADTHGVWCCTCTDFKEGQNQFYVQARYGAKKRSPSTFFYRYDPKSTSPVTDADDAEGDGRADFHLGTAQ